MMALHQAFGACHVAESLHLLGMTLDKKGLLVDSVNGRVAEQPVQVE